MSEHLITGHAGVGHISSDDAGRFNAGVFGKEFYVLDTGTKFAYRLEGNNEIKIGSGDLIMQGRHINVPQNSESSFTIENGLPAMKRIDVVAMRYTKDVNTGIERAKMFLKKGVEVSASETAAKPSLTVGNIFAGDSINEVPMYYIHINNLLVEKVEAAFKVALSITAIESALGGKAPKNHAHNANDITGGTFASDRIPQLAISKINDLQNSLNAKQDTLTSVRQGGKFYHKAGHEIFLDWTDEFIGLQVDDSRRGYLLATGDGKDKYSINQIDGLQTALNKKASSSHSHNVSDIEDPDFVYLNTFVGDVAPYGSNLAQRPQIRKLSDRVEIKGYITFSFTKADASTQLDLLTLPSGYKAPKKNTFAVVPCDGYKVARIYMSPSGKLILDYVFDLKTGKNNDGNVEWLQIDMSWPINSLPKG